MDDITKKLDVLALDDPWADIIGDCEYIKRNKSNKKKDKNSLSYLLDEQHKKSMSQSDCIKLGIAFEKVLKDLIVRHSQLKDIRPKNQKGKKERDHLFIDVENKVIYYAELKANLNLDTEKSKKTIEKCLSIKRELEAEYPEYKVEMSLLGLRYYTTSIIPTSIQKKYQSIDDNLCGINEYLSSLGVKHLLKDEGALAKQLNNIAGEMLKN